MIAATPGEKVEDLMAAAARALRAGDAPTARHLLSEAVVNDPAHVPAWLNLAASARAMGDLPAAMAAIEGALRTEPRNFFALLGKATLLERMGQAKAAAELYGVAAYQAPPEELLDPSARRALQRGRELHQRHVAELDEFLRGAVHKTLGDNSAALAKRAQTFIDLALRKRPNYRQEPVGFFYPGLPAIEFYERELFPWMRDFEAATPVIRDELLAILAEDSAGLVPYVDYAEGPLDQWAELNRSLQWSAYHLMLYGEPVEANCRRAPKTMEAIGQLPQPTVARRSPAAMFSALAPKTRIPPHTGIANTRLVVHLPLIIPPECGFRVGGETRQWREGEAWVFDDTIEHEAWNDSDQRRVILICDIWSPLLTEPDRQIVTEVMTGMDAFNGTTPNADL